MIFYAPQLLSDLALIVAGAVVGALYTAGTCIILDLRR